MALVVLVLLGAAIGGYLVFTRTGPSTSASICGATFAIHAQDSMTGAPIAGAVVTYGGTSARTDGAGNALFAENGAQTLTITPGGYDTETQSGFTPALGYVYSFALVTAAATVTTITTTATSTDLVVCTSSTTTSSALASSSTSSASSSSKSTSSFSTSSESSSSSTDTSLFETFHANFTWSHTTNSSGTTETTSASGTFEVTIDMSKDGGSGDGQGTVVDRLTGICTGNSSTNYTFTLQGGTNKLTGDLTLLFLLADPATATTAITCQNSGSSTVGFGFTSVIPQQITIAAKHGASVSGNIGGTDYEITLE